MAYRTLDDLDSIISLLNTFSNQAQQREQRKTEGRTSSQKSILSDFSDTIDATFDNSMIDRELTRMENYVNTNQQGMTSGALEEYAYIKEKSKYAKEDNSLYNTLYAEVDTYSQKAINLQNAYNDADEASKLQISKDLESNITDYIKAKNGIFRKFGNRLTLPNYAQDATKLEAVDDIFLFGVNSLKDDNYFDDEEKNVFSNSIVQGNIKLVDDYIGKETNVRNTAAKFNLEKGVGEIEQMQPKIKFINSYNQAKYDKANNVEEYEKYKNDTAYVLEEDDGGKLNYTYAMLADNTAESAATLPLDLITRYERELSGHQKNLSIYDKAYGKLTNQSMSDIYGIPQMWQPPSSETEEEIKNNVIISNQEDEIKIEDESKKPIVSEIEDSKDGVKTNAQLKASEKFYNNLKKMGAERSIISKWAKEGRMPVFDENNELVDEITMSDEDIKSYNTFINPEDGSEYLIDNTYKGSFPDKGIVTENYAHNAGWERKVSAKDLFIKYRAGTNIEINKEEREFKIRMNFIGSVLPEVSLGITSRSDTSLDTNNREAMFKDVDNIVDIIGGSSETFEKRTSFLEGAPLAKDSPIVSQQHKNVKDLYEKYIGKSGLIPLRKVIDEYKNIETSKGGEWTQFKKGRLAKKILTRYNTILNKIKKSAAKF